MALVIFTLIVATKDRNVSRIFLSSYLLLSWGLLLFVNALLPRALASVAFQRQHHLPTIFMGKRRDFEKLAEWISQKAHLGIMPVGFLTDDPDSSVTDFGACQVLGPTSSLRRMIADKNVGQVILLELPSRDPDVAETVEICQEAGCRLLIYLNIQDSLSIPLLPIIEDGNLFLTLQGEPLEDPMNRAIKRIFDIAISLPVVVFVLPVLSLWVKIMQGIQAPGPLFFVRSRGGQRRTEFQMLKFRSMYVSEPDESREAQQAKRVDDRVFQFGRFLRKSSLDEFPQFFNVLKGGNECCWTEAASPKARL